MSDAVKVALDVSRGILVEARGRPARVIGYAAAAGLVLVSVGVAFGAYEGVRALSAGARRRTLP